jgi:phosphomannomutase
MALPASIGAHMAELYQQNQASYVSVDKLIPSQKNTQTHALHVKRVLDYVDVLGISSKRYKVVLDSVNGAGCVVTPMLLGKLGCSVAHINATPNGQFPHEPEPTKQNLTGLCEEVIRQKAQIGFAQDPDADRLAIVDENGSYIGEEYTQVLAARLILAKRPGSVAVTNLSSSRMLDDVAQRYGGRVVRTPVGEANVVQGIFAHQAAIGGEGNGGAIDPRIVPTRDSLVGIAYTLALMAETGKTLSELVSELPKYEMVKTKFECRREDANRAVEAVRREFASSPGVQVNTQDGIRIDWPDAWVHARPSNTEPLMRISAEAPDRAAAEKRIASVRSVVDRALK